jgi:DNA-3-methyladenine glycosylase
LNYGIHSLVNVVTEREGRPAAVLLRALMPLEGVNVMRRRRSRPMKGRRPLANGMLADHDLCRGPGNLTMAMGISLAENRADLLGNQLFVEDRGLRVQPVQWGPRIGIRVGVDRPWRAYVGGSPAVSKIGRPKPQGPTFSDSGSEPRA